MKILDRIKNEKVEWKKLGDICEIKRGSRVTKKDLTENGKYPVVSGGIGYMGYINKFNRDENTITIAQYGTAGYVCWQKEKFWANDVCFSIYNNDSILKKYLYYYLQEKQEYLYSVSNRKAIPYSISKDVILSLEIPIPPLETQKEIVRILDTLTEYMETLKLEREQRRKQYEYYLNYLLSKEYLVKESIEIKREKLGDCTLKVKKIKWNKEEKSYKYIDLSSIDREKNKIIISEKITKETAPSRAQQIVEKGDVLFGTTRPLLKRYCIIDEEYDNEICSTGFCVLRGNNKKVLLKWLFFSLMTYKFEKHIKLCEKGSTYPSISENDVKNYKILLPSLKIQEKIVDILDKFEKTVNDLKEGLPREIELRQKQYEYYREKLLKFENIIK